MSMRGTPGRKEWGPSLTKQSARDECDINFIVKRFTKTGQLTHISDGLLEYRDLSGIPDLHEAMTIVADANSLFQELPAEIRKACGHDAGNFIPFIEDEENFDQCVEWGLLPPSTVEKLREAITVPKKDEVEKKSEGKKPEHAEKAEKKPVDT